MKYKNPSFEGFNDFRCAGDRGSSIQNRIPPTKVEM